MLRVSLLAALVVGSASAQAQWLRFQFQSDPGDWIGGGQTMDLLYTPQNTVFFSVSLAQWGSSGPDILRMAVMHTPITTHYMTADFSTHQMGQPLAVGTYTGAERASFTSPGRPGLDISFEHRGSNTLTGMFAITDIDYTQTGASEWTLNRFRATFEQHSEGASPALRGTISYGAVPEPATMALLLPGFALLAKRRRK